MKKLYRSRTDSKLFGLCGGLAELLNVDSTLLRVVLLVTAFFTGGSLIPVYFIACLVIPKEPAFDPYYNPGTFGYNNRPEYGPGNSYSSHGYYGGHSYDQRSQQPYGGMGYSNGYGSKGPAYGRPSHPGAAGGSGHAQHHSHGGTSSLDEMMREVEKKALQKEIEELRAKLAQYEKGDKERGE